MKFKKKPVEIDAEQWDGSIFSAQFIVAWLQQHGTHASVSPGWQRVDRINIPTLEGVMTAQPNDWIIRGVKGECYPCKPDIFAATYELAVGYFKTSAPAPPVAPAEGEHNRP